MNHPSIVTIDRTTNDVPARSYPSGFDLLDQACNGRALRDGQLFVILGDAKSGRTTSLLSMVPGIVTNLSPGEVVCVATAVHTAESVVARLTDLGCTAENLRSSVRISEVTTAADLALFPATVAAREETPAALLVDDAGAITGRECDTVTRVLEALGAGNIASAINQSTGLGYDMFGLPAAAVHLPRIPVVVTTRTRSGVPANAKLRYVACHVVEPSGQVHKSRTRGLVGLSARSGYFVDLDGDNEPCLWRSTNGAPIAILRRCDLPSSARDLWSQFVASVTTSPGN